MLYLMQNIDELRIVFLMVNFKYLKKFWLAGGEIDLGNSRSLMTFGCDMSVKMALYRLKFEYILHIGIIKRCDVCVHITAIFFTPHAKFWGGGIMESSCLSIDIFHSEIFAGDIFLPRFCGNV